MSEFQNSAADAFAIYRGWRRLPVPIPLAGRAAISKQSPIQEIVARIRANLA